jgi:hypothetical protein
LFKGTPRAVPDSHIVTRWFVFRNHEHQAEDGTRVIRGDMDTDLLELAVVWGQGGSCSLRELLLVYPFTQTTSTEGMPQTLLVGARYVEWITAGVRFRLGFVCLVFFVIEGFHVIISGCLPPRRVPKMPQAERHFGTRKGRRRWSSHR